MGWRRQVQLKLLHKQNFYGSHSFFPQYKTFSRTVFLPQNRREIYLLLNSRWVSWRFPLYRSSFFMFSRIIIILTLLTHPAFPPNGEIYFETSFSCRISSSFLFLATNRLVQNWILMPPGKSYLSFQQIKNGSSTRLPDFFYSI